MSISIKDNLMNSQIKGLRLVVMSVLAVLAMVNVQYAQADEFNQGVLRYRTLTENTVEVIAPTSGEYTGDITVPSVVTHNATRYHVTAIGDYAFQGAKQVTSVTLPLTSITTIGGWAFNDCTGLTSFTLPESITKIGEKAFYFCDKLQHLYVHSSQPNSYNPGKEAFLYINRPNNVCTLHVPTGCTKAYAADAAFNVFTQVEEFNPPVLFDLYVAGEQVTELNKADILGDGAASYNAENNVLTISGDITALDANAPCISSSLDNLTIQVNAPATLSANGGGAGIYVQKGNATITGSSKLTISTIPIGDYPVSAIYLQDGDLTLSEVNISAVGTIYCNTGDLKIVNSKIETNDDLIGFGGSLTIENSSVSSSTIFGWESLTLTDCYIKTPQGGYYDTSAKVLKDASSHTANIVEIRPMVDPKEEEKEEEEKEVDKIVEYDLTVAGIDVTSKNASDILGDGAANYNAEKNILTISGNIIVHDQYSPCIFSSLDNLTIQVNAPATLSANGGGAGIYVQKGNATITGSSKLTIISKSSGDYAATAISLQKANLTISDANISTTGAIFCDGDLKIINSQIETNDGLWGSGSSLTIENSSVSSSTIISWKSLTLTDCYIKTPQGGYYDTSTKELKDASSYTAKIVEICPMGDANDNDIVDVADIVEMVNAKNGNPSNKFVLKNADLDGDGKITQADIDKAVELILHKNAK